MNKPLKITALILIAKLLTSGCAGPTSPFGAVEKDSKEKLSQREPASLELPKGLEISFSPGRQIYHRKFDLVIHVKDLKGINDVGNFELFYNGKEVQSLLNKEFEWTISENSQRAKLTIKDIKLPVGKNHELNLKYKKDSKTYVKEFLPPDCKMISSERIENVENFQKDLHMLRMVELMAKKQDVSPSFLAALVAQQSGFNPYYVGAEQRLGLMQIRTLDSFLLTNIKDQKEWPSYPEIDQMSDIGLYTKVLLGLINSQNEWRLDAEKSLRGGIEYLKRLEDFWKKNLTQERNDLILASYYSSPHKVLKSYNAAGKSWKDSDEIASVIPKLKAVKSYCYEFSHASL
jgi:hypothetical protein